MPWELGLGDFFGAAAGDAVAPNWKRTVLPQGPVVPAVSLGEFAAFIEDPCPPEGSSAEAKLYTMYLTSATQQAIDYMDRELEQREIVVRFDQYPRSHSARGRLGRFVGNFEFYASLPRAPIASLEKIETVDEEGVAEELSADSYDVDLESLPPRFRLHEPPIRNGVAYFAGLQVYYTAGYENDSIPEAIKLGILQHAGLLYEQRGQNVSNALTASGAAALYEPYRIRTGL